MAPRPIVAATLHAEMYVEALTEALMLCRVSTGVRPESQSWNSGQAPAGVEFEIDWIPVFQFLLFAVLNTPPNFLWQEFLESSFPTYPTQRRKPGEKPASKRLSLRNTIVKFILDQSIGAAFNTLFFSIFMRSLSAAMGNAPRVTSVFDAATYWTTPGAIDFTRVHFDKIWAIALDEFWPIVQTGWKLWPAVSLINYTMVNTVEGRNLVGSTAGMVWGVYMSLIAASK
ncbi:hypothetical protein HJFPF1_04866 [Paramyrothecium foliicola]|nr:hypothetical protein HJFPF1_04866 [Paramyrothecium foliicola]